MHIFLVLCALLLSSNAREDTPEQTASRQVTKYLEQKSQQCSSLGAKSMDGGPDPFFCRSLEPGDERLLLDFSGWIEDQHGKSGTCPIRAFYDARQGTMTFYFACIIEGQRIHDDHVDPRYILEMCRNFLLRGGAAANDLLLQEKSRDI